MNDLPSLYCKVYVDAPITSTDLAYLISSHFGTIIIGYEIKLNCLDLEVRDNPDYVRTCARRHRKDFVLYRLFIDIDPLPEASREKYIEDISNLLKWLWGQNFPAVAACDFENELPQHELGSFSNPNRSTV